MYITLSDSQIRELIEYLTGTCYSLNEVCRILFDCDEEVLTTAQLQEIDSEIFCCEQCSWWHELSEQGESEDTQICESCAS